MSFATTTVNSSPNQLKYDDQGTDTSVQGVGIRTIKAVFIQSQWLIG
jgi:hypothetical protein